MRLHHRWFVFSLVLLMALGAVDHLAAQRVDGGFLRVYIASESPQALLVRVHFGAVVSPSRFVYSEEFTPQFDENAPATVFAVPAGATALEIIGRWEDGRQEKILHLPFTPNYGSYVSSHMDIGADGLRVLFLERSAFPMHAMHFPLAVSGGTSGSDLPDLDHAAEPQAVVTVNDVEVRIFHNTSDDWLAEHRADVRFATRLVRHCVDQGVCQNGNAPKIEFREPFAGRGAYLSAENTFVVSSWENTDNPQTTLRHLLVHEMGHSALYASLPKTTDQWRFYRDRYLPAYVYRTLHLLRDSFLAPGVRGGHPVDPLAWWTEAYASAVHAKTLCSDRLREVLEGIEDPARREALNAFLEEIPVLPALDQ